MSLNYLCLDFLGHRVYFCIDILWISIKSRKNLIMLVLEDQKLDFNIEIGHMESHNAFYFDLACAAWSVSGQYKKCPVSHVTHGT